LSDFQPDEKAFHGTFPTLFLITSSLDGYAEITDLNLSQAATTGMSNPVTPPPPRFPRYLPTDFDWVSPDAPTPDVIGNIESINDANID
jgi:hypothetical protein